MTTTAYNILSEKTSAGAPVVTVFFDANPGNIVKTGNKKYANFYNAFIENLSEYVPVCEGKSPKFIAGGHSGSGRAGLQAMMHNGIKPDGYIGLSPYQASAKKIWGIGPGAAPATSIDPNRPVLTWGFERQTCGVDPAIAGKSEYKLSGESNRVFYRIDNQDTRSVGHCEFTDSGCFPVPIPNCPDPKNDDVKDVVAEAIQAFAASVSSGSIDKSNFDFDTANPSVPISVFVNSEPEVPPS
ncbi:unnamed protein product [Pseudo-nitzschia multistriata]|uniref:Uncharacterized protein n=1 Tax=Pseudo-nitzschia multistriata TaxID=183589 RepID=A0A448YWS9_9STRA|nr:unnamed protein product [Pseudo-nitzschia multistriata]